MIGRVYRGAKVGGLLRYLYGPGRHNEHENPHLVAAWDLESAAELATLEPDVLLGEGASATRDFGPMTGSMELAMALRPPASAQCPSVVGRQVWHCPLRVAPGDLSLSDAEWAVVARDVMHRTGIARRDDPGGCRWVAVRHDEHSVHLVAVLARQDGGAVRIGNDYRRVREACLAAERTFGLTVTAPADRTAATHTTRAEVEKAHRSGGPGRLPDRVWLREQAQVAAVAVDEPGAFLDRLRAAGVVVRERRDLDGVLSGYAVARPIAGLPGVLPGPAGAGEGSPVFFGGGRLAPDLTLPRLQARWSADAEVGPAAPPSAAAGRDIESVWLQANRAAAVAAEEARRQVENGNLASLDPASDLATAGASLITAAGRVLEGDSNGPLTRGARQYDRAAREPGGRPAPATAAGYALRAAARQLLRAQRGDADSAQAALLVAQIGRLAIATSELRAAQGRRAQAVAAQRAALHLQAALAEAGISPTAAALQTGPGSALMSPRSEAATPTRRATGAVLPRHDGRSR